MPEQIKPAELPSEKSAFKTVLIAGLVAGTLDGLAAVIMANINSGASPLAVFRFIASGWFGPEAFKGGVPMAVYGILFHYLIATMWALFFFLIYPRVSILARRMVVTGLLYGVFVWFVMNVVVLPLTNIPKGGGIKFPGAFIGMGILMLAVGLPVAYIIHRHYRR